MSPGIGLRHYSHVYLIGLDEVAKEKLFARAENMGVPDQNPQRLRDALFTGYWSSRDST